MDPRPIIFFGFANDQTDHLKLLDKELEVIKDHLEPIDDREQLIDFKSETNLTRDRLVNKLLSNPYKSRLVLFHFGGHANSLNLKLDDGLAFAEGLAGLLGKIENLKVVFLNGCSTRGQVELFLRHGVKAVIATSVNVADSHALLFADYFYLSLAEGNNLDTAFNEAKHSFLLSNPNYDIGFRVLDVRATDMNFQNEEIDSPVPWGIYINKNYKQEVLDWKLRKPIASKRKKTNYLIGLIISAGLLAMAYFIFLEQPVNSSIVAEPSDPDTTLIEHVEVIGSIKDCYRNPMANRTVELLPTGIKKQTNANGAFEFKLDSMGNYSIRYLQSQGRYKTVPFHSDNSNLGTFLFYKDKLEGRINSGSTPITNEPIQFFRNNHLIGKTTTDGEGNFSFTILQCIDKRDFFEISIPSIAQEHTLRVNQFEMIKIVN